MLLTSNRLVSLEAHTVSPGVYMTSDSCSENQVIKMNTWRETEFLDLHNQAWGAGFSKNNSSPPCRSQLDHYLLWGDFLGSLSLLASQGASNRALLIEHHLNVALGWDHHLGHPWILQQLSEPCSAIAPILQVRTLKLNKAQQS